MKKSVLFATAIIAGTMMISIPTFANTGGWKRDNRGWWYQYSDGSYSSSSWVNINSIWYYMGSSGYMQTGWLNYGGGWYYLDAANGDMKVGWISINNLWYYFNPSNGGRLDVNTTTPDGYYVDGSGVYQPGVSRGNSNSTTQQRITNKSNSNSQKHSNTSDQNDSDSNWHTSNDTRQVSTDKYENEVIELVNAARAENGVSPLKKDSGLMDTAHLRSEELVTLFSHTRPDGSDCFSAFPSGFGYSGENIAKGQTSPEDVMNSWMNSSGHRANILNGNYDSIGVGCYNENGTLHWVQVFGRKSN